MKKGDTMILDREQIVKIEQARGKRNVEVRFDHGPRFGKRAVVEAARLTPRIRPAKPDEIYPGAELWVRSNGLHAVKVLHTWTYGVRCEFYFEGVVQSFSADNLLVDDAARIRSIDSED